jgi:hypothetical protein
VLAAQGDDQLLVRLLLARLVEHAHVGLAAVEGLAGLAEAAGEPVVDQRDLEHALERVQDGHAARRLVGRDLDVLGRADLLDVGGLFSVRLWGGRSWSATRFKASDYDPRAGRQCSSESLHETWNGSARGVEWSRAGIRRTKHWPESAIHP